MTPPGTRTVPVALVGALDTKGAEYGFVRDRLAMHGIESVLIDTGILGAPSIRPDVNRATVASAAGARIEQLVANHDRGAAVQAMSHGAAKLVAKMYESGTVGAAIVLGGSNAGVVMSQISATLPFGVPKLLVSTIVAST